MLYEVALKRALLDYLDGKEVKAILPIDEDEERVIPFRKLFNEARFLVDGNPAVINQGFDDAIREAISPTTLSEQLQTIPENYIIDRDD